MATAGADLSHTNYISTTNSSSSKIVSTASNKGYGQAEEISYGRCLIATPTVIISGDLGRQLGDLFPIGVVVGEDQVAWARISHISKQPILHLSETLSVVSVDRNSSSNSLAKIRQARVHLRDNAIQMGINRPKYNKIRIVLTVLYRKMPRRGKFWRAVRAAVQEIVSTD